ncbi:MAG: MATE family efflux transporter [Clostridiales bacterium]|nr:MATE family efflux transporter [Candidatus Coliplasma caballi]
MKNKNNPADNKMASMKEGKLLLNMALPMIASMLVQALYNIVDSLYVAKISENAVTALGLAFPVQNMLIGFATGIAVGVNSLFSRSLGAGDREEVDRCSGNGITLSFLASLLFVLFGLIGARPFFAVQSGIADIVNSGTSYVSICCIFSLGIFFEILFERMLQASGRTLFTMITQGLGAILNIILDPMFIFGYGFFPKLGIAGAAVATVIGQWAAAILALIFNLLCNKDVRIRLQMLRLRANTVKQILVVGIPSTIMMAISSVMNFCMNGIFMRLDPDGIAAGVFGLYYKLQSFFFMPLFGLNNATISIVAFNYGSRQPKRILKTLKVSCGIAFGIMMLGLLVFRIFPAQLLGLFGGNFAVYGVSALRIISLHFPIAAFCIVLGATFQALGNGIYSSITALCRQLLALLPAAYLLSLTGEVNAVWWAFPIAELFSLLATAFFFLRIYKKKIKPLYDETPSSVPLS